MNRVGARAVCTAALLGLTGALAAASLGCSEDASGHGGGGAFGSGGAGGQTGSGGAPDACEAAGARGSTPPVVFNASRTAAPGDVIGLQGARFGATAEVWLDVVTAGKSTAPATQLQVVNRTDGYLAAEVPDTAPAGVYAVWIVDGEARSAPLYVNAPHPDHVEFHDVAPGVPMRVFGRNLSFSGATPAAWFVAGDGARLAGEVSAFDAHALTIVPPAELQAGVDYRIHVDNGLGSGCAETEAPEHVLGRAAGADEFHLGVPWAAAFDFTANVYDVTIDKRLTEHAVANDSFDDTAAIREALTHAKDDGGGVVYLPPGVYRISPFVAGKAGAPLEITDRLVVRGAGRDDKGALKTVVQYGWNGPPPDSYNQYAFDLKGKSSGIADLRVENVEPHVVIDGHDCGAKMAHFNGALRVEGGLTVESFLVNVEIDNGPAGVSPLSGARDFLIADSRFEGRCAPVQFYGTRFLHARDSVIRWQHRAIPVNSSDHVVFERTRWLRHDHTVDNTRGLSLALASHIVVRGNDFAYESGKDTPLNDGETILNEGGGSAAAIALADTGTVVSAADNSLVAAPTLPWLPLPTDGSVVIVHILTGAGAGQWRAITSRAGTTLTLDRPWDEAPKAGDHYAITLLAGEAWLLENNTFKNLEQGILLYGSTMRDVVIAGNQLDDSGGIWLRSEQRLADPKPGGVWRFSALADVQVVGNTLHDTLGYWPAYIAVQGFLIGDGASFGMSSVGIELRDNVVIAKDPAYQSVPDQGYVVQSSPQSPPKGPSSGPAVVGTILQRNRAENVAYAVRVNSDVAGTTVWDMDLGAGVEPLRDTKTPGSPGGSVATVVGP